MRIEYFSYFSHKKYVPLLLILIAVFFPPPAPADSGVTGEYIIVGQSCALSGPARDLGIHMKAGIEAAFKQCNEGSMVNGRKVLLVSMDDYYEPGQAIRNTNHLIYMDKVFALIGEVGTPTSKAVVPIAATARVPFLAPYTGARFLREPTHKNVINIRAGYDQETERIARYLVEQKSFTRIACFYQNDSYGRAGLAGIKNALLRRNLNLVAVDTYQRNTLAVMGGFLRIRAADPQAVLLVGAYQPAAEFIKLGRAKGMTDTLFCSLSFAGSGSLKRALRDIETGIIISQVVPSPEHTDLEINRDYQQAMADFQPELKLGYISFEGYIAGRFFIEAARRVTGKLTRHKFMNTIEQTRHFNLGGLEMKFAPNDHQGLDRIYLTTIRDNRIVPLD
ncbi:MAG: leucine/isoleucine/valine-binding protein [Desulfobacteraceae bacterium]|nr:MAG: leucine/isoleucine/valine-binding protein [Desulfobacteraceae bacterium]